MRRREDAPIANRSTLAAERGGSDPFWPFADTINIRGEAIVPVPNGSQECKTRYGDSGWEAAHHHRRGHLLAVARSRVFPSSPGQHSVPAFLLVRPASRLTLSRQAGSIAH